MIRELVGFLLLSTCCLMGVTVYNQTNKNLRLVHIQYAHAYEQYRKITEADVMAGSFFNDCFMMSFLVVYIDETVLEFKNVDHNCAITIIEKDESGEFFSMYKPLKEGQCTNTSFCSLW